MSSFEEQLEDLIKRICRGIQGAINEDPEGCKNLTPEELFKKGSDWVGRDVILTDKAEGGR